MKTELHWSHISYGTGTSVYSCKWQYTTKAGDVAGAEKGTQVEPKLIKKGTAPIKYELI